MATILPQLIGLARVDVTVPEGPRVALAPMITITPTVSYDYADGFDSNKVDGAPNAPVIYVPVAGTYVLFLDNPEAPGSPSTQGGIKARVDVVEVAKPVLSPVPDPSIEVRWYYGDYTLPAPYTAVDPKKAIVVKSFRVQGIILLPYQGSLKFDIAVFRDPMTKFVPKARGIFGS